MKNDSRFFEPKMNLLFGLLFATGLCMVIMGPPDSLDIQWYYSADDARSLLQQLSASEIQDYRWNEILDFIFMGIYTAIFVRALQKTFSWKALWYLGLIPGLLDLYETAMILEALQSSPPELKIGWLGLVTFLKWFLGALLILVILYNKLIAKTHRASS